MNSPAPGWLPDPTSRHQYRYWDGARWTGDVADGGVASTDPVAQTPLAGDPTAPLGPEPGASADPTQQYPTAGPGAPQYGPYYGAPEPPPAPARKGPSPGLLALVAVVAVALIGGIVYLLVRDDGDETADDGSEISNQASTTEPDTGEDSGTSSDSGSDNGDDGASDDTTSPDDQPGEDFLVEAMAAGLEQASDGALTHEQALCASQGVIDELGLSEMIEMSNSGTDPFTDPEVAGRLLQVFDDCGVPPEVLAEAGDG